MDWYRKRTLGGILEEAARRHGDREALVFEDRRWTYGQWLAESDRVAKGLMAYGVDKGDRVGMWSPNYAEWIYVQFATAKIGAIQVNVNPAYRTSELEYAIEQSGMKVLVTRTESGTSRQNVS